MTAALGSTTSFPVSPGPAQPILKAMAEGTLIVNNDPTNAVWISDQPGAQPGIGYYLGVGGSLRWTKGGNTAYAVVDTGVLTSVSLTVGDAISDLQNPVTVGIAVATALNAKGIPNVLSTTVITSAQPIGAGLGVNFHIGGYASILVFGSMAGATNPNYGISFAQGYDNSTALNSPSSAEMLVSPPRFVAWQNASMVMPVTADFLVVKNRCPDVGAIATVTIIGTNRGVSRTALANRYSGMGEIWNTGLQTYHAGDNELVGWPTLGKAYGSVTIYFTIGELNSAFSVICRTSTGLGALQDDVLFTSADLQIVNGGRSGTFRVTLPVADHYFSLFMDVIPFTDTTVTMRIVCDEQ